MLIIFSCSDMITKLNAEEKVNYCAPWSSWMPNRESSYEEVLNSLSINPKVKITDQYSDGYNYRFLTFDYDNGLDWFTGIADNFKTNICFRDDKFETIRIFGWCDQETYAKQVVNHLT